MRSAATETRPGKTPFLDREVPLPVRASPGSGLLLVLMVWFVVVVIVATCWIFNCPPILRHWFQTVFRSWCLDQLDRIGVSGFAVSGLAAFYVMVAIHEAGHVVAGLCVGFRIRTYRVGPLMISRPFRLSFYRGPGAIVQGIVELMPVATDHLAWRGFVMVLGGPVANFVTATVVFLLPTSATFFSAGLIIFSVVNGVSDLLPFESRLGISDGRRIYMLLRHRSRGERWLALLRLAGQVNDGVLPEAMSANDLAKAVAVRDPSIDTVTAHSLAYAAAFHQKKDDEAGQLLETCLSHSGHATPAFREALMCDAAVFQARRRMRADLAEQWLAEIPNTTRSHWLRSRAEAAILEAKGDVGGALKKLDEVEAAILALPDNSRRDVLQRLLQRWKSGLCICRTVKDGVAAE